MRRRQRCVRTRDERLTCVEAKFYYAILSQTGPKLVADLQRAGIWSIIYSLAAS